MELGTFSNIAIYSVVEVGAIAISWMPLVPALQTKDFKEFHFNENVELQELLWRWRRSWIFLRFDFLKPSSPKMGG
jgi:hypothetical protein